MPIAKLFVEGNLEVELLLPILLGEPVVKMAGSKHALKARAGVDRRENDVIAAYLRDRDFDFDPPQELTRPTLDGTFVRAEGAIVPLGWRWCRHETENYLIDPTLVGEATGWDTSAFTDALHAAASLIRDYEVGRWAIGIARRSLLPPFSLRTRPDNLEGKDVALPLSLAASDVHSWVLESIAKFRAPMVAETDRNAILATIEERTTRFDAAFLADTDRILVWFSGKDLLAAMSDWLAGQGIATPGTFRTRVRDWIIRNPERTRVLLPEWEALVQLVRAP